MRRASQVRPAHSATPATPIAVAVRAAQNGPSPARATVQIARPIQEQHISQPKRKGRKKSTTNQKKKKAPQARTPQRGAAAGQAQPTYDYPSETLLLPERLQQL